MTTMTLPIEDMSCEHCAERVHDALADVGGVAEVRVDLDAAEATLTLETDVSRARLAEAVKEAGYTVPAPA